MKRIAISLLSFSLLISAALSSSAWAANAVAQPCKKVGLISRSGSLSLICAKSGSKLAWKKVTKTALPASATTTTPAPASAPVPAPSVSTTPVQEVTKTSDQIQIVALSWSFSFIYTMDDKSTKKSPILYLPQGKVIHLTLTNTADTSHGFWIPGLSLDKEAVPGEAAKFDFTAEKIGTFPGLCNIVCGRGHSGMSFTAQVLSPTEFTKTINALN